jgi:hypothetical protein
MRLTMPPADLRRALMRLQGEAEGGLVSNAEDEREEKEERSQIREESVAAREACRDLLDVLDAEPGRGARSGRTPTSICS